MNDYYETKNYLQNHYFTESIYLNNFVSYSKIVSCTYYFFVDVAVYIEKIRIESYYKKEEVRKIFKFKFKFIFIFLFKNKELTVNNPSALIELKQLGAVLIDKNQTITDNQITITAILLNKELYTIQSEDLSTVRDFISNPKIPNSDNGNYRERKNGSELDSIPNEENDAPDKMSKIIKVNNKKKS